MIALTYASCLARAGAPCWFLYLYIVSSFFLITFLPGYIFNIIPGFVESIISLLMTLKVFVLIVEIALLWEMISAFTVSWRLLNV